MLIYRVENADGIGMYASDVVGFNWCPNFDSWTESGNHPPPRCDPKLSKFMTYTKESAEWYFGFASVEQLKRWIFKVEWREFLSKHGFRVSVYNAFDAVEGEAQAIFKRHSATKIAELCLATLSQS